MWFTKKRVLNNLDDTFIKLLDVVPHVLSRKKSKEYLNEYKFVPENHQFHKNFISDYYYRPQIVPRTSIRTLYDKNKPFNSIIWLTYPLNINKIIVKKHRKMIFKKLDSILESKFGRAGTKNGLTFWHKGFTLIIKNLSEEKNGRLGIKTSLFNTKTYPVEKIFENYEKEKPNKN